jgi:hypothetical protein
MDGLILRRPLGQFDNTLRDPLPDMEAVCVSEVQKQTFVLFLFYSTNEVRMSALAIK